MEKERRRVDARRQGENQLTRSDDDDNATRPTDASLASEHIKRQRTKTLQKHLARVKAKLDKLAETFPYWWERNPHAEESPVYLAGIQLIQELQEIGAELGKREEIRGLRALGFRSPEVQQPPLAADNPKAFAENAAIPPAQPQAAPAESAGSFVAKRHRSAQAAGARPSPDIAKRREIARQNLTMSAGGLCKLFDAELVPLPTNMQEAHTWLKAFRAPQHKHSVESLISRDKTVVRKQINTSQHSRPHANSLTPDSRS